MSNKSVNSPGPLPPGQQATAKPPTRTVTSGGAVKPPQQETQPGPAKPEPRPPMRPQQPTPPPPPPKPTAPQPPKPEPKPTQPVKPPAPPPAKPLEPPAPRPPMTSGQKPSSGIPGIPGLYANIPQGTVIPPKAGQKEPAPIKPEPEGALSDEDKERKQKLIDMLQPIMGSTDITKLSYNQLKQLMVKYKDALGQYYKEGARRAAAEAFNIETYAQEHNLTWDQALNQLAGELDVDPQELRKVINEQRLVEWYAERYGLTELAALQKLSKELGMNMAELQELIKNRGLIEYYQSTHHMDINQAWEVLAEKIGTDVTNLQELVEKYRKDPGASTWMTLPVEIRAMIASMAGVTFNPDIEWQRYLRENYIPVGVNIDPGTWQKMVIQEYADANDMTWKEAHALINKMRDKPNDKSLKDLSESDRSALYGVVQRLSLGRDYISKQDFQRLEEYDRDLANILKRKGIPAYEAAAVDEARSINDRFEGDLKKNDPEGYQVYTDAGEGGKGYEAYKKFADDRTKEWETELQTNDPDGWKVYQDAGKGEQGYNAYKDLINQRIEDFEKEINQPGYPAILRQAYQEGGYETWEEAVEAYNRQIRMEESMAAAQKKHYREAMAELEEYQVFPTPASIKKYTQTHGKEGQIEITYDIDSFIREHPTEESIKVLINAGFKEETINNARSYIAIANGGISEIEKLFSDPSRYAVSGPQIALTTAIKDSGVTVPLPLNWRYDARLSAGAQQYAYVDVDTDKVYFDLDVAKYKWERLSEEDKLKVAGIYANNLYRGNYFAAYTHEMEKAAAEGGIIGGIAFAPILGITSPIAKATTGQEVSPLEWAEAAATAIVDFLMIGGAGAIGGITRMANVGRGAAAAARAAHIAETAALTGLSSAAGGVFVKSTIENWEDMTPAERGLAVAMDVLMFLPLAITTTKLAKGIALEPNLALKQRQAITEIFEADRARFKKLMTNNPEIARDFAVKSYLNEYDAAYTKWLRATEEYSSARVELAQAQEAANAIKFAKTPAELKFLESAQAKIRDLEANMPTLKEGVLQSSRKYTDLIKKVSATEDSLVLEELNRLGERSLRDMDSIADQLVHPRDIETIKADIQEAIKEISPVKNALKSVTLPEQSYMQTPKARSSLIARTAYLNQLNRELYMAKLSNLERIYKNTLQAEEIAKEMRQIKAPEAKATLQKKLMNIEALNAEMKGKLFEGLEKTTEPVKDVIETEEFPGSKAETQVRVKPGGKELLITETAETAGTRKIEIPLRQEYSSLAKRMEYLKKSYLERIESIEAKERVSKTFSDLEKALADNDASGIKAASDSLFKESPAVKERLNKFLEDIKKSAADQEEALKKWHSERTEASKKMAEEYSRRLEEDLKDLTDELKKETIAEDAFKKKFEEWKRAEAAKEAQAEAEREAMAGAEERARLKAEKADILRRDRFDRLVNDKEREMLYKLGRSVEWDQKVAIEALDDAKFFEKELREIDLGEINENTISRLKSEWNDIWNVKAEGTGKTGAEIRPKVEWEGETNLNKRVQEIIDSYYERAASRQRTATEKLTEYQERIDKIMKRIADAKFDGDVGALERYLEEGLAKEGEVFPDLDNIKISKQILDEAERILRESSDDVVKQALEEIDRILKESPDDVNKTIKDIESELKKYREELRPEPPPEKPGTGGQKKTAVIEKTKTETKPETKTRTKTGEELERELYKKKTPTEKPSEAAQKKLEEIKKSIKEKPKPATTKARPFTLPTKRPAAPSRQDVLEPVRSKELTDTIIRQLTRIREITKPLPMIVTKPRIVTSPDIKNLPLIRPQTSTGTKTKAQTTIAAAPQTRPSAQTKPQPATKPVTQLKIKTSTKPRAQTQTEPEPRPREKTTLLIPIDTPNKTPPDIPKKPLKGDNDNDLSDEEKRDIIRRSHAAVTRVQGKLHGKPVWHTFIKNTPDDHWHRVIVIGPKPKGAIRAEGPGSARKSMQRLAGSDKINVFEDTGAVDAVITGEAGKKPSIDFVPDKSKEKKSKVVYRNNGVSITEVNGKPPRQRSRSVRELKERTPGSKKASRPIDLGAGVVREGHRQHIRLMD